MLANPRITSLCKITVKAEAAHLRTSKKETVVDKDVMVVRTDEIGIEALVAREATINRRITTTLKADPTLRKATTR